MEQQIKEYESLVDLLEDLDKEGIHGREKLDIYKRFLAFSARMKKKPFSGSFELTPLCNFDCKMCYVHLSKEQADKEAQLLSTEQWISIMRDAIDAGMMFADLTGGECLSYPGFKEIYMYLVSKGISVSVLTNGALLTEELADFFQQYPPAIVQITLYGSDNDAYERVTGKRAFDQVMAAIWRLKERNIQMFISTTPSQYMQEDTHALLEWLRSLDVPYGIGSGSLPARANTERKREDFAPSTDLYIKLHGDDYKYIEERRGKEREETQKKVFVDRIPKGFTMGSKIPCSAGTATFHITWKGDMLPCVPFHTVAKSVLEDGFGAAWNWIRAKMEQYEPPKECITCSNRQICTACAGEKTLGVLNGPLNRDVCDRIQGFVENGITRLIE